MSIVLIIIGLALIYFGSRAKKANGNSLSEVANRIKDQHVETGFMTVAKYGFKVYAKIMAIAFGVVLILIGFIIMAF